MENQSPSGNIMALFQACAFLILASIAGFFCPFLARVMQVDQTAAAWPLTVLPFLRWYWTIPIGLVLGIVVYWVSRKLSDPQKTVFLLAVSLVQLAIGLFLAWLMWSFQFAG